MRRSGMFSKINRFFDLFKDNSSISELHKSFLSLVKNIVIVQHPPLNPLPSREGKLFYSSHLRGRARERVDFYIICYNEEDNYATEIS